METDRDAYALTASLVDAILAAVEVGARDRLLDDIEHLHPADIADLLEQIGAADRQRLLDLLGTDLAPEVLSELSEGVRDQVVAEMAPEALSAALTELETDDIVDIVEDLEAPQQAAVLEALEDTDRAAVEASLQYPEYSAGRIMQRDVVMAPRHWTVGDAIDHMRAADDLPEEFYDVVLVDVRLRPIGLVRLGKIMGSRREVALTDLMESSIRTIPVSQSQEDVAYAFNQYHMVSAPVVDEDGRLVGQITIDDAMLALSEEADEDIKRLAGLGDEAITDTIWAITKRRFPWLAINLATAILASLVISIYDVALAEIVALAILMPIVASMGGNAGTQSLTVAVRGLATKDLTAANAWRVVRREGAVGLMNGLAFAVIMGLIGWAWFSGPIGAVLAVAMVVNLVVAGLSGVVVPIALQRMGADPALASGTFVTTVTDVVGFFAFLGLAAAVLL